MAAVTFRTPRRALFVGAYARVPVVIDPHANIAFDDLDFVVPAGPPGAQISLSRDRRFNPKRPDIMLLAGYQPGDYDLLAMVKATGAVVGQGRFQLTALWPDDQVGPTRWFDGVGVGYAAGAAWGGGPAGPQNTAVVPAIGTRRIAILFVDTSSQRYTTNAAEMQGHLDRWLDEIVNGVTDGGVTRSARQFYREVSYNTFDLSAEAFGPVQLPGAWSDYFNADGSPKGGYYQACFTAGDNLINYTDFDTLLCVSQSVTGPPAMSAWPYASIGNWGPYTTADGSLNRGVISMPNEWGTTNDREVHETFCHELGHNLGLGDQYRPSVPGRNAGSWELMDWDDPWPHFSIVHRMMLGWVQPGWLEAFNFQSMAAPVDQTITLHPIEEGAPPGGRRGGVEIRLADGWNYYFEYRAGQGMQIGDRNLPTDSRVLGTDVVSGTYAPPYSRPGILLLNNDGDGDGAVLGNGQDYEETDTTDPTFPTDFRVSVAGVDGTKADVRVQYGVNSRPDPSIRPWPAAPDRQWQSPDIEVRNARNQADPAWFNVPWAAHANTVIARVTNRGRLDAPAVRVNFFVKDYTVGGVPETFVGTDVRDVAAGATVEFSTTWTPPGEGHYCIVIRIPLYQLPANAAIVEQTELNNVAQSNYERYISATASLGRREMSAISVGNPYPIRTRIFVVPHQSNPLYRTYLGAGWLTLDPGETRTVPVMYEYAIDPKALPDDPHRRADVEQYERQPNNVGFAAFAEDPGDMPRHVIDVLGGAQTQVVTGRATEFREFSVNAEGATGLVATTDDGRPVPGGHVILSLQRGRRSDDPPVDQVIDLQGGIFFAPIAEPWRAVQAYFAPPPGFADCSSQVVHR